MIAADDVPAGTLALDSGLTKPEALDGWTDQFPAENQSDEERASWTARACSIRSFASDPRLVS